MAVQPIKQECNDAWPMEEVLFSVQEDSIVKIKDEKDDSYVSHLSVRENPTFWNDSLVGRAASPGKNMCETADEENIGDNVCIEKCELYWHQEEPYRLGTMQKSIENENDFNEIIDSSTTGAIEHIDNFEQKIIKPEFVSVSTEAQSKEMNTVFAQDPLGDSPCTDNKCPYTCTVCEATFAQRGSLTVHMRIHIGDRPSQCTHRETRFSNKGNLLKHTSKHTGERPYGCTICKAKFSNTESLIVHMRTHESEGPYTCSVCDQKFVIKGSLLAHMSKHRDEVHYRLCTGEKKHPCSVCKAWFSDKPHLNEHMRKHSGEKKHLCCPICGAWFSDTSHRNEHMRRHAFKIRPIGSGEKKHPCSMCGAWFSDKPHLNEHMRKHTGEKKYLCSMCGARFLYCYHLNKHMRNAHTFKKRAYDSVEKKHPCSMCGAWFSDTPHLNEHMRRHTCKKTPFGRARGKVLL